LGATGLFLLVVAAGRLVEQGLDFAGFHAGLSKGSITLLQFECQLQTPVFKGADTIRRVS
ncbi:hypothetical protein, partial [Zoogloea sp.]|uniref:hypothetical protein n=1 Tax=Zoogloea sp. TaxID=49181 RepID=UPI0025F0D250